MSSENDLLIANIHTLQETLESLVTDHTLRKDSNSHLSALAKELESIELHLHATQEKLEEALHSNIEAAAQLDQQNLRIQNLLARLPGQWETERFNIRTLNNQNDSATEWSFKDIYIGDTCYAELDFETLLNQDRIALKLRKFVIKQHYVNGENANMTSAHGDPILISPIAGNAYEGSNATISQLDTSTWVLVVGLISKLIDYSLSRPANAPKLISRPIFLEGLRTLYNSLRSWAPILRYDHFSAVEELTRPYYAGLSITFQNLSQNQKIWPYLKFTFATVDNANMGFGANPRIEFPEHGASHALSSWYAEKDDEEGKRLELRFASSDNMDMHVWRSLNEADQILVAGIIIRLPHILAQNQDSFMTQKYSKAQWIELAHKVKINFTKNVV